MIQNALETAGPLVRSRRHELIVKAPTEPVMLEVDATRIAQVFVNLLNNAAKFTESGGRITFAAEVRGDELTVTVSDTGIGVAPEMLPMIFDMFAQADRSLEREQAGLGVGLSLARHLVEMHGGSISASSPGLGQGSAFVVKLPCVVESRLGDASQAVDAAPSDATRAQRILLADDNVDLAESLSLRLEMSGHDVRVANDGAAALEMAATFVPDFAFLDIGLPKINGYDLARRLRAMPAQNACVFVAVTGWGQEDDRRKAREAGFDHHLVKPVEPEQILDAIATYRRTG